MSIAFLGHSYHRVTASSRFMQAILEARVGAVEAYYDESWNGGEALDVAAIVREGGHDAIHVWQMESLLEAVVAARPSVPVIWYPMFDSCRHAQPEFWARVAPAARIVSFCREVHQQCMRRGLESAWFQFFPDPADYAPVAGAEGVFRGPRRAEFGWEQFRKLLPEGYAGRIHLHAHPDPGTPAPAPPSEAEVAAHGLTVSTWFEDRGALERLVAGFAIYVAPRLHEGIGMAFLEALARGQCVVAADLPTMNEYITHGVNGLLFDPQRRRPLDFGRAQALGARARDLVALGHIRWERDAESRLLDVLTAPLGAAVGALAEPFAL